ncbi:hypothetical protein BST61_g3481 [Cercospora zeina]
MQFKYFLAVIPALVIAQETTGPIDAATSAVTDIVASATSVASEISESITSEATASASSEAIQSSIESIQSSASSDIESIQLFIVTFEAFNHRRALSPLITMSHGYLKASSWDELKNMTWKGTVPVDAARENGNECTVE